MKSESRTNPQREMTLFQKKHSIKDFFGNFLLIRNILIKNSFEFKKVAIIQTPKDIKKEFEEKVIQGYKSNGFRDWMGVSPSKHPKRVIKVETQRFLKSLVTILNPSDNAYERYCDVLYHIYYKYALFGSALMYSFPFIYLKTNKNLKKMGIMRFSPFFVLLLFSSQVADGMGNIGISRNSLTLLYYVKKHLTLDDAKLSGLIEDYLREKCIKLVDYETLPKGLNRTSVIGN